MAILLLLGVAWLAWPNLRAGSDLVSKAEDEELSLPDGKASARDGSPRSASAREGEKDGTVKLRSLLELREGEMAVVEIPPENLKKLSISVGVSDPADVAGSRPGVLAHIKQEELESIFAGASEDTRVRGKLQMADGKLEWDGARLKVDGRILRGDSDATLMLNMSQEGRETMVTTFSVRASSLVILYSSSPDPEGLAILVGGAGGGGDDVSKDPELERNPGE
jgi:hypothetical protein